MHLQLNAFQMTVGVDRFKVQIRRGVDPKAVREIREQHRGNCFVHFREGTLYFLPIAAPPGAPLGEDVQLETKTHEALSLLSARLNDVASELFPQYAALRLRPFTFEGQKHEMVERAAQAGRCQHPLLNQFTIRPRFVVESRLLEAVQGDLCLMLTFGLDTKWTISAQLHDLAQAGISLEGLYVVRRVQAQGERRLVGRIARQEGTDVVFSEAFDDVQSLPAADVMLEGSRTNFAHCLKRLLGTSYASFDDAREYAEAELLKGPAQAQALQKLSEFVRKHPHITLAPGLTCSLGPQVEFQEIGTNPSAWMARPEEYCFDAAKTKREKYAWKGLERFGPFDRETFPRKSPRILVVFPNAAQGAAEQFVKSLRDGVQGVTNSRFSQGFARLFGLEKPQFELLAVASTSGRSVHQVYRDSVEGHLAKNSNYEAAIVVIDDQHAEAPAATNPYLHAKAILMQAGIPVQEIRRSNTQKPGDQLQWILQNFAIALYSKMGGTPWTIAHDQTVTDELVIGLGTCEMSGSRFKSRQRFVGITTVFRGDGNYLLANVAKACPYEEYGSVLRASMTSVLTDIKTRNGWQAGDRIRIVVHSFKPLKAIEIAEIIAEAVQEVAKDQIVEFAFVNVVQDHPFKLLDAQQLGMPTKQGKTKAEYVPHRGVSAQLGSWTRLLCMNGPTLIKREVTPLPSPLLLNLHPSSTYVDQRYLSDQVLKFSALSWRSTLPTFQPVTIYYSELIASLLARLQHVPDWSPSVLNTKLRASRWFL